MIQYSSYTLNTFVAPDLAGFVKADIPDLRSNFPQAEDWLANYFLNSLVRASYPEGVRQLALGYIRRAHHSFVAYHTARDKTLEYLNRVTKGEQPLRLYWDTVHDWEIFVLETQMAITLFNKLTASGPAFDPGDGSAEQRLYDSANAVKHPGDAPMEGTLPLWVLEDGIHSVAGFTVGYSEASDVLSAIADIANRLQDPASVLGQASSEPSTST